MKKFLVILTIAAMLFSMVGCSKPDTATDVVDIVEEDAIAKVNGVMISKENFERNLIIIKKSYEDLYGEDIFTQKYGEQTIEELIRSQIAENMVLEILINDYIANKGIIITSEKIDEAYESYIANGLAQNPEIEEYYRENGIDEEFIKKQITNQLNVEKFFEAVQEQVDKEIENDDTALLDTVSEVKAKHILVEDEALATEILEKINNGEKFEDLAIEHSIDPGSKELGGDLGYFKRGVMVPEFETAAFSLNTGEVSGLVKSQFGYHIIKVEDVKSLRTMTESGATEEELNLMKDQIISGMINEKYLTMVDDLKAEANIEFYEDSIKDKE